MREIKPNVYCILCFGICFMIFASCAVGKRHTPDLILEQNLTQHKAQFEILLANLQSDRKLEMIGIGELRYAGRFFVYENDFSEMQNLGLIKQRWLQYQRLIQELGLKMVLGGSNDIEFKADSESLFNGDSRKGYLYAVIPPRNLKPSLDEYRISENDRDSIGHYAVYKAIKGHPNWYLYLYAN